MVDKVRHQLFLPRPVSDRLEALAAKPGASKSAILTDAVTAWLNRRGASELEDRFAIRLDRLTAAIGRLERDGHIQLETLALFVRYELAIQAPLAENDHAGRALATPCNASLNPAPRHRSLSARRRAACHRMAAPQTLRAVAFVSWWPDGSNPRGWVSALVFIAFAAVPALCATW